MRTYNIRLHFVTKGKKSLSGCCSGRGAVIDLNFGTEDLCCVI